MLLLEDVVGLFALQVHIFQQFPQLGQLSVPLLVDLNLKGKAMCNRLGGLTMLTHAFVAVIRSVLYVWVIFVV